MIIAQVVLIFSPVIPILVLRKTTRPYRRGFFCDDQSLMYPFKQNTISLLPLILINLLFTLLFIFFSEAMRMILLESSKGCHKKICSVLVKTLNLYKMLLFVVAITWFLTDMLKYGVGRLRPHFFAVCGVDVKKLNCSNGGFITNFECKSEYPPQVVRNARESFPSGHTSVTTAAMLFCIFYVHDYWRCALSYLFRPLMQLIFILIALFCSWTRVSDNMHHPTDVVGGILIGLCVSLVIYFICMERPILQKVSSRRRSLPKSPDEMNENNTKLI